MKILVTGGLGFIGSSLSEELLKQGHEVLSIDNLDPYYDPKLKLKNEELLKSYKNFNSLVFDLIDKERLDQEFTIWKPDVVFHAAAKAGVRPSLSNKLNYVQANISVLTTVLETMRAHDVKKMVFCSSSSVYGKRDHLPATEDEKFDKAISFYATTKQCGELINQMFHNLYGFSILNLRFFTVYGPRQRPDLAISKFLNAAMKDEFITVYGDGRMQRDYTYIDDIVGGCIKSIEFVANTKDEKPLYETLNLGSAYPVDIINLLKVIESVTNIKLKVKNVDVPMGDVPTTFANINNAKKLLGWEPQVSLKEGIAKFYASLQSS